MSSKGKAIKAGYRLIVESFPSGRGRHSNQDLDDEYIEACTTRRTIGTYNTEADAIQAAKVQRKATCQFVGWADDLYKDDPPPYHSAGCVDPDPDEDEDVSIFIEDISAIDKAKEKEMRIAKADPPPKKKAKFSAYAIGTKIIKLFDGEPYNGKVISYDTKSKFYKVQYEDGDEEELESNEVKCYLTEEPKKISSVKKEKKKSTTERKFGTVTGPITNVAVIDENIFLRNPCRIAGGKQHLPREYGNSGTCKPINSYYYLLQRLSDRNYAMRGLCIDGDGAQYTSFKKTSIVNKCVVFLPETDLNDHADDPTIVDACHLDLICPSTGDCFLTAENLLKAVTPRTECIFINGYQLGGVGGTSQRKVNPNVIVDAIDTCRENLQCFSLTESVLTNEILLALAKCKKLKGVTLSMTQKYSKDDSTEASDEGIESIIMSCPDLSWLFVEETAMLFGDASWKALDSTDVCPKLEVLWISSYHKTDDCHHVTRGDHSVIRRVLSNRYASLKLCMINPDERLKSRYTIGGSNKTDRLEGDKIRHPYK
jgi:hypothetical protein